MLCVTASWSAGCAAQPSSETQLPATTQPPGGATQGRPDEPPSPSVDAPLDTPTTQPNQGPAGPPSEPPYAPAEQAESPALQVLRGVETALEPVRAMRVRIRLDRQLPLGLDNTTRFGTLLFARPRPGAQPPDPAVNPRFDVRFDSLRTGDDAAPIELIDERFVFDGRLLLEVDSQRKLATLRELARPGERVDLEANGFVPLPLDLNTQRMTAGRDVDLVTEDQDLDSHTLHREAADALKAVRLRPKTQAEADRAGFTSLILLIDTERNLPHKVEMIEPGGEAVRVTLFLAQELELNPTIDPGAFNTTPPDGPAWEVDAVRLGADG